MGSWKNSSDRLLKRSCTKAVTLNVTAKYQVSKVPSYSLVIHSEPNKPLCKLSPFLVHKVLLNVIGKMFTAKKMPSGNLLVEVENQEQSKAFLIVDFV